MKKIIFAQVLTSNGKTEFLGLYDKSGNPVTVDMECDKSGVALTIWRNEVDSKCVDCGISDEEIQRTCYMQENCNDCPLKNTCKEEMANE